MRHAYFEQIVSFLLLYFLQILLFSTHTCLILRQTPLRKRVHLSLTLWHTYCPHCAHPLYEVLREHVFAFLVHLISYWMQTFLRRNAYFVHRWHFHLHFLRNFL